MIKKYILMHKDKEVIEYEYDIENNIVTNIINIYDVKRIPLNIHTTNGYINKKELNIWIKDRALPDARIGLADALSKMDIIAQEELLMKSLGLSLSDHYWFNPVDNILEWKDVNFFNNEFSDYVGEILLEGNLDENTERDFLSPCSSLGGNLQKQWKIINGDRYLIKGGSGQIMQEPFNEIFATSIHEKLNVIEYTRYSYFEKNSLPFCKCKNFVNTNTELISARTIVDSIKKKNDISYLTHFKNICRQYGIKDIENNINYMLTIDYLIANTDRHLNNFGIIRDVNTLEWLGVAPIFDCGNSMWFNQSTNRINFEEDIKCTSFYDSQEKMIKQVSSFENINIEKLKYFDSQLMEILKLSKDIDATRIDKLCFGFNYRKEKLENIIHVFNKEINCTSYIKKAIKNENIKYKNVDKNNDFEI